MQEVRCMDMLKYIWSNNKREKIPHTAELIADMRPAYGAEEVIDAQSRFAKFISAVSTAHLLGVMTCIGLWHQYPDAEEVRNVLITSGMIFAIGLATALGSYVIFRTSVAMSREAALLRQNAGDDEGQLWIAREKQADAVERAKSGFKPLNFSGVCFVASALIEISGLLSI